MFRKIILWLSLICMSAVVFGFSSDTAEQSSGISEKITEHIVKKIEKNIDIDSNQRKEIFGITHIIVRKGAHFSEFAVLGILSFLLASSYGLSVKICTLTALSYCLFFAVCDEVHQVFVDGRAGKVTDVCIDFFGSFSGIMLCRLIYWYKKKKKIQY